MRPSALQLAAAVALLLVSSGSRALALLAFEKDKMQLEATCTQTQVVARYPFKNTGSAAVRITAIRTDCSCTTHEISKEVYEPGESGEVVVKFEPAFRHGPQKRAILVSTDDREQPLVALALSVAIPPAMTLSEDSLLWTEGERGRAKVLRVAIPNGVPVDTVRAGTRSPQLNVAVERKSREEYEVTITPAPGAHDISTALALEAVLPGGMVKRSSAFLRVR